MFNLYQNTSQTLARKKRKGTRKKREKEVTTLANTRYLRVGIKVARILFVCPSDSPTLKW
jgi:hypothetical protein